MAPSARSLTVFSRREIEGLIAEGKTIVIVDQNVLKTDAFIKYHPGGKKAMQHMVGRDATDEVTAYVRATIAPHKSKLLMTGIGYTPAKQKR